VIREAVTWGVTEHILYCLEPQQEVITEIDTKCKLYHSRKKTKYGVHINCKLYRLRNKL
jgi:hypothetical protein